MAVMFFLFSVGHFINVYIARIFWLGWDGRVSKFVSTFSLVPALPNRNPKSVLHLKGVVQLVQPTFYSLSLAYVAGVGFGQPNVMQVTNLIIPVCSKNKKDVPSFLCDVSVAVLFVTCANVAAYNLYIGIYIYMRIRSNSDSKEV